jgi:hypothetical protein
VPPGRAEAIAALLCDIAVPDMSMRWAAVDRWSREVPLLDDRPAS